MRRYHHDEIRNYPKQIPKYHSVASINQEVIYEVELNMLNMFNIKKRYFKRILKQTIASIWSTELARYITLYDREVTRQKIDQASDVLNRMKANPNTPKEELEKVEKSLESLKKTVDEIDEALDGSIEKGLQGLNHSLEALVEKREHIKNFIKHYC